MAASRDFCDFHLFARPPRLMIVNGGNGNGGGGVDLPVGLVTVLEVRHADRAIEVAAWVAEVLAREAAAQAGVPVRVYHHDPHGNVHSWSATDPHRLTRERVAPAGPPSWGSR
ncbi:MAG: hypothetical protein ACRDT2_00320 [Natronosporangium sp.]